MEGRQPPAPEDAAAAADVGDLRADVEVAFEIGPDPEPADPAAAPTIGGVGVALELVDLAGPPVRPGDRATADLGPLGRVGLSILP